MKAERLMKLAVAVGLFAMAVPASAISFATVGSEDTLLAETSLANSGDAAEEAWVESILGVDVTLDAKNDTDGSNWELVDGTTDVYAYFLDTDAEWFLIKTGNITDDGNTHFLFDNLDELAYAVIELSDLGITFAGITGISHVTEFGGSVPEPSALLLMGAGLAGLAAFSRKRA